MTSPSSAHFKITGASSGLSLSAAAGHDAVAGEVLTFELEDVPALDVSEVVYSISQKTKGAPVLTLSGGGAASTPTAGVTTTLPGSGAHSFMVRCTATTTTGVRVFERVVALLSANASLRKFLPAERGEYDPESGWSGSQADMVDAVDGAIASIAGAVAVNVRARLVATTNLDLSGSETIDGTATGNGDIVLAAGQTDKSENGPYNVNHAGLWTRADGATLGAEFPGMLVSVSSGASYSDTIWQCTTNPPVVVDTTNLVFEQIPNRSDKQKLDGLNVDVVAEYGAVGNGSADDQPAIQGAIDAVVAAGGGIVHFPGGSFRIRDAIQIDGSGVVIEGTGRETEILVDEPACSFVAVLFQKGTTDPEEIQNVGIRNITIRFADTGGPSLSGLQFNSCVDFFATNVTVKGDGAGMNGSTTDGIAVAIWSRSGLLSGCVADGMSKPGIYLAECEDVRAVDCLVRSGNGTLDPPGYSIGDARNCALIDCHSQDNEGSGFVIASLGATLGNISALTNQTHFTVHFTSAQIARVVERLGVFNAATTQYEELDVQSVVDAGSNNWTVILNTAPSQTLSSPMDIQANFMPYRNVKILGGSAVGNGAYGIVVGTNLIGSVGKCLEIANFTAKENAFSGLSATSVEDLYVRGGVYTENDLGGIEIQDIGTGQGSENQTNRITIDGAACFDNTLFGLWLDSVNDVTVHGGFFGRTSTAKQTTAGIYLTKKTVITTDKRNSNIRLLDPDLAGYATLDGLAIAHASGDSAASQTGHYRIQFAGSPSAFRAPPGSVYVDKSATSIAYLKTSGFVAANWNQSYSAADAASTATASQLALRDSNGDCAFRYLTASRVQATAGLELYSGVGSNAFVGPAAAPIGISATDFFFNAGNASWLEGAAPILFQQPRTSDAATHDLTLSSQAPVAGATNFKNPGNFICAVPAPAAGGTDGEWRANVSTVNTLRVGKNQIHFNAGTPVTPPTYTVANHTTDRALDETGDTLAQVANVLGTLINDLKTNGILQ